MKKKLKIILPSCVIIIFAILTSLQVAAKKVRKDFYQLKVYTLKNNEQVKAVDTYLQSAFLPAIHRAGIQKIGVFKPIANDTSLLKKIYVLIPFSSLKNWQDISAKLEKDVAYQTAAAKFIRAAADQPPFERKESILLEAFDLHPNYKVAPLKSPASEKVYELRSYESPTEDLHIKKVKMFNEGDEIGLFKRLGFNAIFYGKVISGSNMPNLMYMTSFENMENRDAHWKAFGNDPQWKKISAMPEYENKVSVSRNDRQLMRATEYSDL